MNLGIFLSPGDSLKNMSKSGQGNRLIETYLKVYSKNFEKVYLFSFENESLSTFKNVVVVKKENSWPRLVYALFLPLVKRKEVEVCDVFRGLGLASSISALLLDKKFVFNWAFDYYAFVRIEKKYWYIPFYFFLEKLAFLKAKKIFIATKTKFTTLHAKKFLYLPNGVDINQFKSDKKGGRGLVFVGRLEKQKNLFFLIDSIKKLPNIYREITVVGNGSQKKMIVDYAKKNKVRLKVINKIDNGDMPKFYRKFSIFVLPSFQEGSPKVLFEAMACGLVPIITNFPTARDVVDNNKDGLICNFDSIEYSNAILKTLKNQELREKLSRAAILKIKTDFNLQVQLEKEIEVLKSA